MATDTIIPLTSSVSAAPVPPWIHDICRKMSDIQALCRWLELLTPENLPKIGTTKGYDPQDWATWCADHGFEVNRTTKHATIYRHPRNGAQFSIALSIGDYRVSMNICRDIRKEIQATIRDAEMTWRLLAHPQAHLPEALLGIASMEADTQRERCLLDYAIIHLSDLYAVLNAQPSMAHNDPREMFSDGTTYANLRAVLQRIESEFNQPRAGVLAELLQLTVTDERVTGLVSAIEHDSMLKRSAPGGMVATLQERLTMLREMEREERAALREKRSGEKGAKQLAALAPRPPPRRRRNPSRRPRPGKILIRNYRGSRNGSRIRPGISRTPPCSCKRASPAWRSSCPP